MDNKSVFNVTVCLLGTVMFLIHIVNIAFKREKRKDEACLLIFFVFTALHFLVYSIFTFIKVHYTSDEFIMAFYTTFYIMNNIEVLLFFLYLSAYSKFNTRYKKLIHIVDFAAFIMFVISDIVNIFTRMYFTSVNGVYTRSDYMIVAQGYQFLMLAISFVVAILNRRLSPREKIAFSAYCVFPLLSIIIQNRFAGYAIAYATLLVAIEVLFLFLNVERNIKLREEEKQLEEANVKIMVSQIQPHFVYNTLSSISTLIDIDPNKAQKALDEFTDYLRMNFSTLTETKPVSFEDELKHIKTYVDLEKMRFNDRLNVVYDIGVSKFDVPPLSIQPLVENAIKHGILKKIEGGTVTLRTFEDEDSYNVAVIDNGVGFNMEEIDFESNKHIGLKNVRHRINTMSNGEIRIQSTPNVGTTIVIRFYK